MKKVHFKERSLDLHGVTHADAFIMVENYVMDYQNELPLKIITGNSDQMKSIVIQCLKSHNFKFHIGDEFNKGYIVVLI